MADAAFFLLILLLIRFFLVMPQGSSFWRMSGDFCKNNNLAIILGAMVIVFLFLKSFLCFVCDFLGWRMAAAGLLGASMTGLFGQTIHEKHGSSGWAGVMVAIFYS